MLQVLLLAIAAPTYNIASGDVTAGFDTSGRLTSVSFSGTQFNVTGDAWAVNMQMGDVNASVTSSDCTDVRVTGGAGGDTIVMMHLCGVYAVNTTYTIHAGSYLVKAVTVQYWSAPYNVTSADIYSGVQFGGMLSFTEVADSFHNIAGFARMSSNTSLFLSLMTPFGTHTATNGAVTVSYSGITRHESSTVTLDAVVLGHVPYLSTYKNPFGNSEVTTTEVAAFKRCVDSFRMGSTANMKQTVKVNVAWDENDYQLDAAAADDLAEYKRVIDMNGALGIAYQIMATRNTRHSSRFNTTDGWGWEDVLWFSMGELLREGKWSPVTDPVPQDILDIVKYADTKGVKLLAYVYPCLAFQPMHKYFVSEDEGNVLDLGAPPVKDWLINVLDAFLNKTGAAGFAWDHNFVAGPAELHYSQWKAWFDIRTELVRRHPAVVFDNRIAAHAWGPWFMMHPGYSEPLYGDENPETYGVAYPSFHTDVVAANQMRHVSYTYSAQSLLAPSQIPGFISHQTERSDATTTPCVHTNPCYGMHQRDFDLLGYRFSLLSTIGTAGLNLVWAMMPGRDLQEYQYLPSEDRAFIAKWLAFTDANIEYLRNTDNIATLQGPVMGKVDGTHAMYGGGGYLFFFNMNYADVQVPFMVDDSIGLYHGQGKAYGVTELYPQERPLGTWLWGSFMVVKVVGQSVLVLKLTDTTGESTADVVGAQVVDGRLMGFKGHTETVTFKHGVQSINNVTCRTQRTTPQGEAVDVQFGGDYLSTSMPLLKIAEGNEWVNFSARISDGMKQQLNNRAAAYPIQWNMTNGEYNATWLVPTRLPLYFFSSQPNPAAPLRVFINDTQVELAMGYTSREVAHSNTFLGYWYDATPLLSQPPEVFYVSVNIASDPHFIGVYWENIRPEATEEVVSC